MSRTRSSYVHSMRVLAAFGLLFLSSAGLAQAAPLMAVDVVANNIEIRFAEGMTFSLVARSTRPIERIVLRYSIGDPDIVDRRIPIFESGAEVVALHEEQLVRGQIPPTAEITWWWTLEDKGGERFETERSSARYFDEKFEWDSVGDAQVRVWHEGGKRAEADAQNIVASGREAIDYLAGVTGRPPDEQVEIVAYSKQEDLRRALAARGDVYETRLRTLGARVAPTVVVLDTGSGGRDLDAVIFHELSHVVLGLHMEQPWVDLPAWLDEGFAMFAEGDLGGQELPALENAIRQDDLMSVRSLSSFPGDAERVTQAYGQSRDFVAFLVEEHDEALFRELLDTLALGDVSVDDALSVVYGYDRLSMYQAYRASRGLEPAEPAQRVVQEESSSGDAVQVEPPDVPRDSGSTADAPAEEQEVVDGRSETILRLILGVFVLMLALLGSIWFVRRRT